MNKREAFKALAEGKKVRPVGVIPNDCYCGYYVLDTYGNIDDDESGCNWDDDNSNNWEIYEPPKNKVKKKVKAWLILYHNNLYALYLSEHSIPGFDDKKYSKQEIEFEIELEE